MEPQLIIMLHKDHQIIVFFLHFGKKVLSLLTTVSVIDVCMRRLPYQKTNKGVYF